MTNLTRRLALTALIVFAPAALAAQQAAFTLDQVMSPPFPDELVAAPRGGAVAWVFNGRGARNIWVAAPPDYRGKAITSYPEDDGQELTDLRWTPDGRALLFEVRKNDAWHLMRLSLSGGAPEFTGIEAKGRLLSISLSPDGSQLAYSHEKSVNELWALDNVLSVVK